MCSFTKFVFVKKSEKVLSFVWFMKWGKLTWCRECKSITHGSVKICGWTTDNVRTYIQRGQVIPDFTDPSQCGSWRRICIYFLLFYVTFLLEIVGNCASFAGWDRCSLDKFDSLGKAQDLFAFSSSLLFLPQNGPVCLKLWIGKIHWYHCCVIYVSQM